jgi:transposase
MNTEPTLFDMPEVKTKPASHGSKSEGAPRLVCANRSQLLLRPTDLETTLALDHQARTMWAFVNRLDISGFMAPIRAREGEAGRSATDPKILLTLWLYATSVGVGSARELDRLCVEHDAYRWICGGVPMNYHSLSDFRVGHEQALDELFTQVLAVMMSQGLVKLSRIAQDGTRVRASAGAASFRREPRLKEFLAKAKEQVEHVKRLAEDPSVTAREAAAQKRAAEERQKRIEKALEEMPKARAAKQSQEKKEEARVSTTDPEARVMKMGDGGFRPAYNLQFATTTNEKVIVGVDVTNIGSDKNEMTPMLKQIEERTGERPKEYLVDGGFVKLEAIEDAEKQGTKVYAPEQIKKGEQPTHQSKPGDTPEVGAWRERMGTDEAKEIYKERCATAELVNADIKEHRGLKIRVRGMNKVLMVGLWSALTYNLLRWATLSGA